MALPLSLAAPRVRRRLAVALARAARLAAPWRPYLTLVGLFVGGSLVVGPLVEWSGRGALARQAGLLTLLALPLLAGCTPLVVWAAIRATDRAAGGTLSLAQLVRRSAAPAVLALARLWGRGAVIATTAAAVLATESAWRLSIPALHPFAWDRALERADRWLHGGVAPWRMAHALAGGPAGYAVLETVYSRLWFVAAVGTVAVLVVAPAGRRAQRVLVAFVLVSAVLGSGLATLGSSAGPIYYGRALGLAASADPYAGLHAALRALGASDGPLTALWYQDYLWRVYEGGNVLPSTGVTAFPSMHLAAATLLVLAAWSWRRWAGVLAGVLGACTLVGSVYFGWHYALDGYASILVTCALWWVAGRLTRPVTRG